MTFKETAQFHGHECPGLAMGYRMATAAMEALASTRSEDEEIVAITENNACGVDALQCISGCTAGKGNLIFRDYGKQAYTLYSRQSRKGVRAVFYGKGIPSEVRDDCAAMIEAILSPPWRRSYRPSRCLCRNPNRPVFMNRSSALVAARE